jgi:hypothetical protein
MPYEIVKVKGGYKVRNKTPIDGKYRYYSLKPLSKTKAKKQLIALKINYENKYENKNKKKSYNSKLYRNAKCSCGKNKK